MEDASASYCGFWESGASRYEGVPSRPRDFSDQPLIRGSLSSLLFPVVGSHQYSIRISPVVNPGGVDYSSIGNFEEGIER
jgi:hypothetical protein